LFLCIILTLISLFHLFSSSSPPLSIHETAENCIYLKTHKKFATNAPRIVVASVFVKDEKFIVPIQDFASYKQTEWSVYVDKTHFIPKLVSQERVVLLRPRRFGKSLNLSMLKYFFYGATDLFRDTALFNTTFVRGKFCWCPSNPKMHNFPPCPVIHLDFSGLV